MTFKRFWALLQVDSMCSENVKAWSKIIPRNFAEVWYSRMLPNNLITGRGSLFVFRRLDLK